MIEQTEELLDAELARFAAAMRISLDMQHMDDDDIAMTKELKRIMRTGVLSFNDEGCAVVTCANPARTITMRIPLASDMMILQRKGDASVHLMTFVAQTTGVAAQELNKLPHYEWRPLQLLVKLFL